MMRNLTERLFGIFTLLLLVACPIHADVVITELMPCNTSTYINDLYDYEGYAELYNNGDKEVDLKGFSFVNNKKNGSTKWSWTISSKTVIKPKAYCMIFFDEVVDHSYHVGYKLDADGGALLLSKDNEIVSSIKYPQQYPHLSYGVDENGILGYMEPTPKSANTTAYKSIGSRCAKPEFSIAPGVKNSAVTLELSSPTDSATIYYTINGDIPVVGVSKVYTAPILIKTSTVVRAIAVKDSMLKSEMTVGSYLYSDAAHNRCNGLTSNIVSIVTDKKFYYDGMQGIYTDGKNGVTMPCITTPKNYARDWTRAANMEYIVDGEVVVNQEVETSIKGGCSRMYSTKSLGIKTNKKSGKKGFDYVFFPDQRPGIEYESLHLRNGGNAYSSIRFRDGYMASLANALGIDCQAYEPVAAYINGTYMGMMGLRSPANKSYVKTHYGLEETDIDFIEFAQKVDVTAGDTIAYNQLVSMLRNNDPSSNDYFYNASQLMDMDNYIDYNIFQQFIVNTDWPGNNQKLWRERNGGKFRWIAFDLDFGLGLYSSNNVCKKSSNMLEFVLGSPKDTWNSEPWMISPFAELMKNDEFKYRFLIKFMHHLKYSFTESVIDSVWMSISDKVADEYCATRSRDAEADFLTLRSFAVDRPTYIYKHLQDYFKAGNKVALQVIVKDNSGNLIPNSSISINNQPLGIMDYRVDYYSGIPLKVDVKTPNGYKFKNWVFSSTVTDAGNAPDSTLTFEGKLTDDMQMVAVFERISEPKPLTLQLNEICSSNNSTAGNPDESGHYSDWIEVYNYGTEDLDLAGMFITDKSSNQTKYMFPYGSPDTKVEAGKCIVVWADNETWRGPLHANFKLSASGSFVGLAYNVQGNVVYLDSISCPYLLPNDTYGRRGNGKTWEMFTDADGESQVTFGLPNKLVVEDTIVENPPLDTIIVENPPLDTTIVENPPLDTTIVENPPLDTTIVENPPLDTTIVENPSLDTTIVENPPLDTTIVENPPLDTTIVENPPLDTTIVENPPLDTTIVDNPPLDTTIVENPPLDTTIVDNPPLDTTIVENPPLDTTIVENPPLDTTIVDNPPLDTTIVENPPLDTTIVENPPLDTTIVENPPLDTTIVENPPLDTTIIENPPLDTTIIENPPLDSILTDTTVTEEPEYGETASLYQPYSKNGIILYPNPVHDEMTVESVDDNSRIMSLVVYNSQGAMICSLANLNEPLFVVPTASFAPGMYIVRVETNYAVTHKKFEKR